MKKRNVFAIAIASLALALGVGAGLKANKKETKLASATGSTITVYITDSWDKGTIKLYQWGGDTDDTVWGWDTFDSLDYVGLEANSHKVFKAEIPSDRTGLIFAYYEDNQIKQSVNIESGISNNAAWYYDSWGNNKANLGTWTTHPYTINYNGNGNTSGSMASEGALTDVAWVLSSNQFVKTGYVFTGWNTSADGNGTSYSNTVSINPTLTAGELTLYAQWRKSYASGMYALGTFGSGNWDMDHAVIMNQSGGDYVVTISLNYGDVFKVCWYNDANEVKDNWYGYSRLYNACGAYHYFSADNEDSIVCYARGSYTLYAGSNISIELNGSLTAEHLAAQLMQFGENPSSGHCGDNDRFPAMKEVYLGLSPEEQSTFQGYASSGTAQFKNAYDRYVNWAAALGQDPWSNSGSGARVTFGSNDNSTNVTLIIVIVSTISLVALGGFFFIKRKKEN